MCIWVFCLPQAYHYLPYHYRPPTSNAFTVAACFSNPICSPTIKTGGRLDFQAMELMCNCNLSIHLVETTIRHPCHFLLLVDGNHPQSIPLGPGKEALVLPLCSANFVPRTSLGHHVLAPGSAKPSPLFPVSFAAHHCLGPSLASSSIALSSQGRLCLNECLPKFS